MWSKCEIIFIFLMVGVSLAQAKVNPKKNETLVDKDIGKKDLRAALDALDEFCSDKNLNQMLNSTLNSTQLLTVVACSIFSGNATKGDKVIIPGLKSFDNKSGKIDSEKLRTSLITWGDKFSEDEVDDAFDQMVIDEKGFIDTAALITMIINA